MSAFDIAGAIVWSAATVYGAAVWRRTESRGGVHYGDKFMLGVFALLCAFPAAFCIARLCGAHA